MYKSIVSDIKDLKESLSIMEGVYNNVMVYRDHMSFIAVSYRDNTKAIIDFYEKHLSKSNNVKSSMIWGSQWDQIMIWMKGIENTVNSTNGQYYVTNAVGMGNYGNISGVDDGWSNEDESAPTGYQENYKVKNIFDLAGNVYDWTLEATDTNSRVQRRRRLLLYQ